MGLLHVGGTGGGDSLGTATCRHGGGGDRMTTNVNSLCSSKETFPGPFKNISLHTCSTNISYSQIAEILPIWRKNSIKYFNKSISYKKKPLTVINIKYKRVRNHTNLHPIVYVNENERTFCWTAYYLLIKKSRFLLPI